MTRPNGLCCWWPSCSASGQARARPDDPAGARASHARNGWPWRATRAFCCSTAVLCVRAHYYGSLLRTLLSQGGRTFGAVHRGLEYSRHFSRSLLPAGRRGLLRGARALPVVRWLLLPSDPHLVRDLRGRRLLRGTRFYVVLLPFYYLLIGACAAGPARSCRPRQRGSGSADGRRRSCRWWRSSAASAPVDCGLCRAQLLARHLPERGAALDATVDNNVRYMKWLGTIAPPGASMVVGDIALPASSPTSRCSTPSAWSIRRSRTSTSRASSR